MSLTDEAIEKAIEYNGKVAGALWSQEHLPDDQLVQLPLSDAAFSQRVAALQAEEQQYVDGKLGPRSLHALEVKRIEEQVQHEQQGTSDLGWWTQGEPWPEAAAISEAGGPNQDESLDNYLRRMGVIHFNAYELTRLHRWGRNVEPLRRDWSRIVPTARLCELLRHELGENPLLVTSGYRPRRYNIAVGGAANSQHMAFRSMIVNLHATEDDDTATQRALYEAAAKLFVRYGDALKMGLGFYRKGHGERISIDTGFRQRSWRSNFVKEVVEETSTANESPDADAPVG